MVVTTYLAVPVTVPTTDKLSVMVLVPLADTPDTLDGAVVKLEPVHVMVAPAGVLVKFSFKRLPLHTLDLLKAFNTGIGFTVTVNVFTLLVHAKAGMVVDGVV